jgi:hypothetical protein
MLGDGVRCLSGMRLVSWQMLSMWWPAMPMSWELGFPNCVFSCGIWGYTPVELWLLV